MSENWMAPQSLPALLLDELSLIMQETHALFKDWRIVSKKIQRRKQNPTDRNLQTQSRKKTDDPEKHFYVPGLPYSALPYHYHTFDHAARLPFLKLLSFVLFPPHSCLPSAYEPLPNRLPARRTDLQCFSNHPVHSFTRLLL